MNVIEASTALHLYFQENDCFEIEADYKSLFVLTDQESEKEQAAVLAGLKTLEDLGVVRKQEYNEKTYWILIKNLATSEQTVSLPGEVCANIANAINTFCDMIQDNSDKCSPYSIGPSDIVNLLHILNFFAKEKSDSTTDTI